MDNRVNRITAEIAAVVERNLRRELLREREAMLRMMARDTSHISDRCQGTA